MSFFKVSELPRVEMTEGIGRRVGYLEGVMLTFFDFTPGAVIPVHQHPHQQISLVLEGALEFTLGDETQIIAAGEGGTVPPNTPHGARVLERPTRVLDAWHPVREDYK